METLVRSWGQGQFREPHQVRIDREGLSGWSIAGCTS